MKRTFPNVRWFILAAINVQCLVFYVRALIPGLRLEAHSMGRPFSRLAWWTAVAFAVALARFPGTTIDRFGRSVMVLAAMYCVLIAAISEWSMPLSVPRITQLLAVVSAPVQLVSVLLLVRKMRSGM